MPLANTSRFSLLSLDMAVMAVMLAAIVQGHTATMMPQMMELIKNGTTPNDAYDKLIKRYGRFDDAAKIIDPRKE